MSFHCAPCPVDHPEFSILSEGDSSTICGSIAGSDGIGGINSKIGAQEVKLLVFFGIYFSYLSRDFLAACTRVESFFFAATAAGDFQSFLRMPDFSA